MGKFWEDEGFKKIQNEWYKTLNKEGFEDAEKMVGGEMVLTQRASNAYRQADLLIRSSKEDYFDLLTRMVQDQPFDDEVDKLVMTRLSEGISIKEISKELEQLGKRSHRQTIRFIKRKYENRWGIKTWKKEQMASKRMRVKK